MSKLYGFKFAREIAIDQWQLLLNHSFTTAYELLSVKPQSFFLFSEENITASLSELLPIMESDLSCQIAVLITHDNDLFCQEALNLAFKYQRGQVLNLADVCLIASIRKEVVFLDMLRNYFNNVEAELLRTIVVFLQHALSHLATADYLYIHRNTLAYRLNQFQQLTKMNIADFDNAAFFRTWCSLFKIN